MKNDESIPEPEVEHQVARELLMHHGRLCSRGGVLEDQRVVRVVHEDHEPERLVPLTVGGAEVETIGGELGRTELVQVELGGEVFGFGPWRCRRTRSRTTNTASSDATQPRLSTYRSSLFVTLSSNTSSNGGH